MQNEAIIIYYDCKDANYTNLRNQNQVNRFFGSRERPFQLGKHKQANKASFMELIRSFHAVRRTYGFRIEPSKNQMKRSCKTILAGML